MKIKNILSIALLSSIFLFSSCAKESNIAPPISEPERPEDSQTDGLNNIVWSNDFNYGGGGYPRMAEMANGNLLLGMDSGDGIKIMQSLDEGITFQGEVIAAPNNKDNKNEGKGNVFPLELPNGDIVVAYRHLNDTDKYDNGNGPDGINWYNIDMVVSKDGGLSYQYLSSPLNDPRNPYTGESGLEVDQSEGAWEPFLFYNEDLGELWCLYSRQNEERDSHPLWLTMKRSTDNGVTWGEEEVVVGTGQFGAMGSAGMNGVVKTESGQIIVVFETQSKTYNNAFSIGMVTSDDNGATWSEVKTIFDYPVTQSTYGAGAPYISILPDGKLMVTMQYGTFEKTQFGYVLSDDGGATWSSAYRMWMGEAQLWNSVFVSSGGTIFALSSGVKYKIGTLGSDKKISKSFYMFAKSSDAQVIDANFPWPPENNNVHTWAFAAGAEQGLWNIRDNGDGYFWLQPVSSSKYGQNPGKCLTILADNNVMLNDFAGNDSQLWNVKVAEEGYYTITSKDGENVLTIENDEARDDANVIALPNADASGQQFKAIPFYGDFDVFADWLSSQSN